MLQTGWIVSNIALANVPLPVMLQMGGIDRGRCRATALQWSARFACISAMPSSSSVHSRMGHCCTDYLCSHVWMHVCMAPVCHSTSAAWSFMKVVITHVSEALDAALLSCSRGLVTHFSSIDKVSLHNGSLPANPKRLLHPHTQEKAKHPPSPRSLKKALSCAGSRVVLEHPLPYTPFIGWMHEQC